MRKLLIDCQILQTPAFDRGMGKYTLSVIGALIRQNDKQKRYNEIQVLLNKNLDCSKDRITTIAQLLRGTTQILLDLPTNIDVDLASKYSQAEATITSYVADLEPGEIDFLVTSPFFVGFPAVFPQLTAVRKYSIVYDFIPYKIWHLQKIFPDDLYARQFQLFLQADHLFTISKAVRSDLIQLFGFSAADITSIDGGPFRQESKGSSLKLTQPCILFPSAPIVHKNNINAARAFARFNTDNRYKLYITSTFDDKTKQELTAISPSIEFTGNISDAELISAYRGAAAVFFPSLAEGLGMPVLEGVLHNVPVACSDIPVLSELSRDAFYQFDPNDIEAMAATLKQAVHKEGWADKQTAYKSLLATYTWDHSAAVLLKKLGLQKKTKSLKAKLYGPAPNRDTPAGRLCELLYSRLVADRDEASAHFKIVDNANCASYAAYLPKGDGGHIEVRINNRRHFSFRKKGAKRITLAVGTHTFHLYARRQVVDGALQLYGWTYYDEKMRKLGAEEVHELIKAQGV